MKQSFLFFTLLLQIPLLSSAQVKFNPSQMILMQGKRCEELEDFASAIARWTTKISGKPAALEECFCSSKSCQMDVAPVSPYFVKNLTSYETGFSSPSSAFNGPNCFNAALHSTSTLPNITFTHPFEMTAILDSSLCTERKRDEPLMAGDILVVRNQKDPLFEIHAGVYIAGDLSFSKYGQNKVMPYSYGLTVDKSYGVKKEACRRVEGQPLPGDECYEQPFVNYYTCKTIFSLISKVYNQPGGFHPSVSTIYAETSRYDAQVSDIAFKGNRIDHDNLGLIQENLSHAYSLATETENLSELNVGNKEVVRMMRFRLFSLFEQTRMIANESGFKDLVANALPRPR